MCFVGALMDLGISDWVAGAGLHEVKEAPGFRSCLTPTPATLPRSAIIRERDRDCGVVGWLEAEASGIGVPKLEFGNEVACRSSRCRRPAGTFAARRTERWHQMAIGQ